MISNNSTAHESLHIKLQRNTMPDKEPERWLHPQLVSVYNGQSWQ